MNYEIDGLFAIAVAWIAFIIGCCFGAHGSQSQIEKDAIKAGVAYYTNNADGQSVFKWKECK